MRSSSASIEKFLDILSSFDFDCQEFSIRELSTKLGIPLSTTYKYVDVLVRRGFLVKDAVTRKVSLGLAAYKIGALAADRMPLLDIARPHMIALSRQSRETVTLTVVYGWESLCIEKIETPMRIQLLVEKGSSIPLHAGASQTILLAFQEERFVDAMIEDNGLRAFSDNTVTDPVRLKARLKSIRDQGFSFSDGEYEPGAAAVAAPIFDHRGRLAAGLSILGPRERLVGEKKYALIEMVKGCASQISSDLGFKDRK
ncbi:MAG: IclR family transcriptional regulator [Deltaproteobacteria bacterium]|nr:IclR family transcriptional regulator [Deltaproteobacteria bacterium]